MANQSLADRIAREIEKRADLHVNVEERGDTITLTGMVDSAEAHDAAIDIAANVAPGRRIDDGLEVVTVLADDHARSELGSTGNLAETITDLDDPNVDLAPDFTQSPVTTDERQVIEGLDVSGSPDGRHDDGDLSYSPPTDPVVTGSQSGNFEVIGGFGQSSTSAAEVAPSAMDNQPGDEALADAIRRELREDAATTDLKIEVEVRRGVARLRGRVSGIEDVENVEEVAARIPGVVEVVEELEVQQL